MTHEVNHMSYEVKQMSYVKFNCCPVKSPIYLKFPLKIFECIFLFKPFKLAI